MPKKGDRKKKSQKTRNAKQTTYASQVPKMIKPERKIYQTSSTNFPCSSQCNTGTELLIPFNVSQGTGQANRIGNRVFLEKVIIRGHVNMRQTTSASIYMNLCKVWVGRLKSDFGAGLPSDYNALMQSGNTSTYLGPDVQSFYRPFNTNRWIIYRQKNMKIGYSQNGGGAGAPFNNDFKAMVPYKFTLYPKRVVNFDDANTPIDYNLILNSVALDVLGSGAGYADSVEMHYEAIFIYTDV